MSGSPPVLSISWSDHSFSGLASSFAWILAHSSPRWRSMLFSKRAFNARRSSSRCLADRSFFFLGVAIVFLSQSHKIIHDDVTHISATNRRFPSFIRAIFFIPSYEYIKIADLLYPLIFGT